MLALDFTHIFFILFCAQLQQTLLLQVVCIFPPGPNWTNSLGQFSNVKNQGRFLIFSCPFKRPITLSQISQIKVRSTILWYRVSVLFLSIPVRRQKLCQKNVRIRRAPRLLQINSEKYFSFFYRVSNTIISYPCLLAAVLLA